MKIKFTSEETRELFRHHNDSTHGDNYANDAIADYMGMETHDAVNHSNGDIELVDKRGYGITISSKYFDDYSDGWKAIIYIDERSYFDIEGE